MIGDELLKRFTYHTPLGNQPELYGLICNGGLELAQIVDEYCPDSREKSLAITHIEEAVMWANAAIARNS